MNISLIVTWKVKCGIAVYAKMLRDELRKLGVFCEVVDITLPDAELVRRCQDADLIHLQNEPMFCSPSRAWELVNRLTPKPVIATLHRIGSDVAVPLSRVCKKLVVLRPTPENLLGLPAGTVRYIDMGTPEFPLLSRSEARQKYGIPENAFIISTFGFLSGWKTTHPVVRGLVEYMRQRPEVRLQLLTSHHSMMVGESQVEKDMIARAAYEGGVSDRILHLTDFLSDVIIHERLCASDVGFQYAPVHTGSSSAASRRFIAAGVPLVITESNHFETLTKGVQRTAFDLESFVNGIAQVSREPALLARLRTETLEFREETGWSKAAGEHLKLYNEVLHGGHTH